MISHEYKCIFIHIPKTGGTSIEKMIWPLDSDRNEENLCKGLVSRYRNKYQTGGLQHLKAWHIEGEVGSEIFSKYYKFSVVRNPWDKAVSQYMYMKKRRDLRMYIGMWRWTSFKKYLSLIPRKTHVQWEAQNQFITDSQGQVMVDYIIRFEDLQSGMSIVSDTLGLKNKILPHLKKSERDHYSTYYDAETREMVADIYKEDVLRFNYTFQQV